MSDDEMEATKAPLLDHLIELRTRLIRSFAALAVAFIGCYFVADDIFNILLVPYEQARGGETAFELIYTAPHEFFFTQMKLALFGAVIVAFPIVANELWKFVAPGLYKNERRAFLPFLLATPVLFALGASLVFFFILPFALRFFLGFEQPGGEGEAAIHLLPKVSEYLGLVMTLILAFGFSFQMPVLITLLGRVGILDVAMLRRGRRYAILVSAIIAAIVTPPDVLSQLLLLIPMVLLYEISILVVARMERGRAVDGSEVTARPAPGE